MFGHLQTKEKRAELRFPLMIPSSCNEPGSADTVGGQTHDISRSGVCLIADKEIPLGTQMEILLVMLDTNEIVQKKGIIIWSTSYGDNMYRMGIKLQESKLKPVPLVLRTIMALAQAQRKKEPV